MVKTLYRYYAKKLGTRGYQKRSCHLPGFSADCLETLEEINIQNREIFLAGGGEQFHYIPALNHHPSHIEMLANLLAKHAAGWPQFDTDWDADQAHELALKRAERAVIKGAVK